jgi:hypothetical protein
MGRCDIPEKLDKKYGEKKVFSLPGSPILILQKEIKEGKVQ